MLKIYGNPMSTCTRKVLMTLAEDKTPYEMTVVDLSKGEHKSPEHMRHQPFGRVPAMDDDGFQMHESRAMARYIDAKASGSLTPSDPKSRAMMEQWISVEQSEFTPNAMKFIYKHIFKRDQPQDVMTAATTALETTLDVMDRQLASHPFIAGSTFTLADVFYMPYLEYIMTTPAKDLVAKRPHVSAWWEKIRNRPTWKKAIGQA